MAVEAKCQKELHTNVEENLRSKTLYKLFLGFLKIIPMLLAGLYLMNTILSYFDIDYSVISYVAGIGIIPWAFIMMASYVLRFCEYHRMFLWYVFINNILCWTDQEIGLPIDNWNYFILHVAIAGVFMFLVLYFHQKCKKGPAKNSREQ